MPTHTSSRRDTDVDALLDRVAAGDAAAYERLYDEVSAPAYGLASRIVRDPRLAEDVTQEVFLDVWRNAARFDAGRGRALTWILTIVHRRAVDAVRRSEAQRRGDVHAAAAVAVAGASVGESADGIMQAEEQATVRDCLGALTALQLESVRLAYYQGYTYRELATLLDKPLPTIKTRIRDGLIRLRDCLERADGGAGGAVALGTVQRGSSKLPSTGTRQPAPAACGSIRLSVHDPRATRKGPAVPC